MMLHDSNEEKNVYAAAQQVGKLMAMQADLLVPQLPSADERGGSRCASIAPSPHLEARCFAPLHR